MTRACRHAKRRDPWLRVSDDRTLNGVRMISVSIFPARDLMYADEYYHATLCGLRLALVLRRGRLPRLGAYSDGVEIASRLARGEWPECGCALK